MEKTFLSIVIVIAISLSASSMAFPSAMGSGHRVDMIFAQSMEQEINQEIEREVPSDQGTSQKEVGYGQGTAQDTESTQSICTGPTDCPEQKDTVTPDNN